MNVQTLFRKIDILKNVSMDVVLFESKYPVLFTCKDEGKIYLFICCLVNSKIAKWIGTETRYETLIELLEDKIPIRDAFLKDDVKKMIIEYDGIQKCISCNQINGSEIPESLLPTVGEYMEAEDGEFDEEIQIFKSRIVSKEVIIKPQENRLLIIDIYRETYKLSDEFFGVNMHRTKDTFYELVPDYRMKCAFA